MEHTITPAQMKELEARFMREQGVPGILLMEQAARAVCAALEELVPGGRVLFLCGPGNNGGDGYAAARLWRERGGRAILWELTDTARGDALTNRTLALLQGIVPEGIPAEGPLPECDAVCDALFGTGLSRALEGPAAMIVDRVNASGLPVVAVDIPSGLDGTTGHVLGRAVRATVTVTFHRVKQGLVLHESASYVGELRVAPILIPKGWGDAEGLRCLSEEDLPGIIPARDPGAHKGTCGRVVLLVGSEGMAGAAALCARAAIRAGAGLTTILTRRTQLPILQALVPGATCRVLPEEGGCLTDAAIHVAEEALKGAASAAVGCGLSRSKDTLPLLEVFRRAECPVVWDADALNLLSEHETLLPLPAKDVATPHPGEAARLLGCEGREVTADTLAALDRLRGRLGCHVLLKGARTVMTDGRARAVNRVGSPAMAKGGSGDVLTGILAGLLAQRLLPDTLTVMQCAALIHGMAGKSAAKEHGVESVLPEELCAAIRVR